MATRRVAGPGCRQGRHLVSKFAAGQGLGLAGLKDRVETLGGKFTVDTAPGGGGRVSALLNLHSFTETAHINSGISN